MGTSYINHLCEFNGTRREFMEKYQKLYPNATKQIYKDVKKPLSRNIRDMINSNDKFKQLIRSQKLGKLFDYNESSTDL